MVFARRTVPSASSPPSVLSSAEMKGRGSRGDQASHETTASTSCPRNLHVLPPLSALSRCPSLTPLVLFSSSTSPPPPAPSISNALVLQEVGEPCDRNRNISERCFDVFHKVDPETRLPPPSLPRATRRIVTDFYIAHRPHVIPLLPPNCFYSLHRVFRDFALSWENERAAEKESGGVAVGRERREGWKVDVAYDKFESRSPIADTCKSYEFRCARTFSRIPPAVPFSARVCHGDASP